MSAAVWFTDVFPDLNYTCINFIKSSNRRILGDDHLILKEGGGGGHFWAGQIIYFQHVLGRKIYFRVNRGQNIYFRPQQIFWKKQKKKKKKKKKTGKRAEIFFLNGTVASEEWTISWKFCTFPQNFSKLRSDYLFYFQKRTNYLFTHFQGKNMYFQTVPAPPPPPPSESNGRPLSLAVHLFTLIT